MRNAFIAALVACSVASIGAQDRQVTPAKGTYKVPRTPDGRPDLQGYWTNLTYTPFERPE